MRSRARTPLLRSIWPTLLLGLAACSSDPAERPGPTAPWDTKSHDIGALDSVEAESEFDEPFDVERPPAAAEPEDALETAVMPQATPDPPGTAAGSPETGAGLGEMDPCLSYPNAAGVCEVQSPDTRRAGSEKARIRQCSGSMSPEVRTHMAALLRERLDRRPDAPGFDRFITLGASASRNMYFMTGFGRGKYTLAPDWEFLRPTIEHFSQGPRRNSFLRKNATASGTTAGAYIWPGDHCPDCPELLTKELNSLRPAFAVVMFGTNNVRWAGSKEDRRLFLRPVAAGWKDPGCKHKKCLDPWDLGPIEFPDGASDELRDYVARKLERKRALFRRGLDRLLRELLAKRIVPIVSTIPPMPRRWLDEDTVYAINEEIREVTRELNVPLVDLWCAMNPTTMGEDGERQLDWSHPVLTNNKGIGTDRYHPQARHAFDISDENLVYGYNVRNVLTLLRLAEMRELAFDVQQLESNEQETAEQEAGAQ